jgi:prepilin-type N-terminal cleavage/methylation domain-containing protein
MSGGLKTNRGILRRFTKNRGGFTIVEVLIVLAVTGLIFLAAVLLVAGRQGTTQFALAANEIETEVQQTAEDVSNGYYPNSGNFSCSSGNPPSINTGINTQGTNSGCVFWGKVVQFAAPPTIYIYPIVGNQSYASGQPIQSFTAATPGVVVNSNIPVGPASETLEYGLTVNCMQYSSSNVTNCLGGTSIGALAFITTPNDQSSAGQSTAAEVSVAAIIQPALGGGPITSNAGFNLNNSSNVVIDPSGGVQICFASGSTNQSALMQIGGNNRNALVTMSIKNDGNCT